MHRNPSFFAQFLRLLGLSDPGAPLHGRSCAAHSAQPVSRRPALTQVEILRHSVKFENNLSARVACLFYRNSGISNMNLDRNSQCKARNTIPRRSFERLPRFVGPLGPSLLPHGFSA